MKTFSMLVGTLALAALPLLAHHQFSSEYDSQKPVTLTGTITQVNWDNPHVHLTITSKTDSGKANDWQLEAASPTYLEQHGVKQSAFAKGQALTVHGYRASNGERMASARTITMNGKNMQVCDPTEDGGPAK